MNVLYALDLFGVFVFAVSGAFDGVKHQLDLLGIMVLAVVTGVGGGIIRDLILGETPPASFHNETYLLVCLLGSFVVMLTARYVNRYWEWVRLADAIGLGVFTAIGSVKAANHGLGIIGVLMLGSMTAVGGGLIRDLFVREVPMILRADFYASAAIIGSACLLIARQLGATENVQIAIATSTAILIRCLAIKYRFSLPKIYHA
jgi:uncharacterized membrane protein YeiH